MAKARIFPLQKHGFFPTKAQICSQMIIPVNQQVLLEDLQTPTPFDGMASWPTFLVEI